MNPMTEEIKREALRLGFSKVGIAPVDRLESDGLRLKEWLARGYHGTMDWMSRNVDKRIDLQNILPGATSVISVAMNYYTDSIHKNDFATGKVSRYAWGDDYHEVLSERLKILLDFIKQKSPDTEGKVYVDTGPVMEKVWAEQAGIGWEGKHTNVITQEYGSWVFLGEIILTLPLEYDTPATDHCGSCTLCIEACPTDAIVEAYVLDSNKCISYLTIEHRGEIAKELGEKFDRWIYGCDICQDVCPWNHKFSIETQLTEFEPRKINQGPNLELLSKMTAEEFSQHYKKSSMKRTKHSGLMRNVNIVLSSSTTELKR